MTKDNPINITIARPVMKGSNEQAKQFGFSFEGSLQDFDKLQKGVDEVISRILWDKADKAPIVKEPIEKEEEKASI